MSWLIEAEWCIYTLVNQDTIGSDNGLLPDRPQAITPTYGSMLVIEHSGIYFHEIWVIMQ